MPRAGHKQAKKPPGAVLQRDPPAAAKRGKIPDPTPAGLCRAAFAGGRPAFSEHIPHGPQVSARGSGAKAAACAGPAAAASARAAKNKKAPGRGGRSPARSFAAFGGQTARAKAPCSAASPAGAGAFPQKKQRTPPCVALRPLLFVWSYFFGSPLAKSGSAPSSPPGRKTRRPVFQPLCHACRMVSSAGAWQKE